MRKPCLSILPIVLLLLASGCTIADTHVEIRDPKKATLNTKKISRKLSEGNRGRVVTNVEEDKNEAFKDNEFEINDVSLAEETCHGAFVAPLASNVPVASLLDTPTENCKERTLYWKSPKETAQQLSLLQQKNPEQAITLENRDILSTQSVTDGSGPFVPNNPGAQFSLPSLITDEKLITLTTNASNIVALRRDTHWIRFASNMVLILAMAPAIICPITWIAVNEEWAPMCTYISVPIFGAAGIVSLVDPVSSTRYEVK